MEYGYFCDEAKEYVILTPKTPVKWINYIGSRSFGGFVDQTGGVLLCKGDPALNRITKYIPQLPASDFRGETLYLRVRREGEPYRLFSPFFTPCLVPLERYECRVGLGYSRFLTQCEGLQVEITVFVPAGAFCEVRDFCVTNLAALPQEVDAVPVVEYSHFDALKQFTNADWVPQTMTCGLYEQTGGLKILTQYAFMRRDTAVNYFTSSLPVSSFETDRWAFLGDNEYGSWAGPLSLAQTELPGSLAQRGDNISALLHHLGILQPGESRRLVTLLGQAKSVEDALPEIERYRDPTEIEKALAGLAESWRSTLERQQVITPDPALNSMLNVHNPRQCRVTQAWSRDLSLYQLGFGGRGVGVRDASQDLMGILPLAPEECKEMLRLLLQVQRRDGSAFHQFVPLTMQASEGDSRERKDRLQYYSDDHLWVVLATAEYLKETGDFTFLDECLPFYDRNRAGQALESTSVWDHLSRAVQFSLDDRGAHGLPRLGFADWNDTINLPTGAESVLSACLCGAALRELSAISRHLGKPEQAARLDEGYTALKAAVSGAAWDGEWFVSYFDQHGEPLGSQRNLAGQIYAYGQAWPVLAGFATPQQARLALDAVRRRLDTAFGIKLSTPGFNGFDPEKGGITTYPPGAKENCGIFLHANPWIIIAETLIGGGERAYYYYQQINPAGRNDQLDVYQAESYVYPQNILSDEHPRFGLARNSWLSGTASWMYQAGTKYLLGVRPEYAGLRVDPCIPLAWKGYEMRRQFRGAIVHLAVMRAAPGEQAGLWVDGLPVTGNLVPLPAPGTAQVKVVLKI